LIAHQFLVDTAGILVEQADSAVAAKGSKVHAAMIWFGSPSLIDSKIYGQNLLIRSVGRPCHCAGNVTAKHAKHTKRNPPPAGHFRGAAKFNRR